jgi:hypothetical protein
MMHPRVLHAAITAALTNSFQCPRTMQAVEDLCEGFRSIDGCLHYLWNDPDALTFPRSVIGIEHSHKKQAAFLLITGKEYRPFE